MNPAQTIFLIFFVGLFPAVLFWFYLVFKLFRHLRTRYPAKYDLMGQPGLFRNNNLKTNVALLTFLFKREDQEFNDVELSRLTRIMRAFFIAYSIVFTGLAMTVIFCGQCAR